jgi:polyisoprenoid-binding protein YceI
MITETKTLWKIDPTHSEVQFKVKHLVISTVTGSFGSFDGQIEADDDHFENASAKFTADIDSISTNNEDRDQHLKSDDFFNADTYPQLRFESTKFEKTGKQTYKVTGNLIIRDVTKEVELDVVHGGTVEDPYGNTKAGFEITGIINRKEFGLTWNAVTEAGSVVVGDKVKLQLNVQFVQS